MNGTDTIRNTYSGERAMTTTYTASTTKAGDVRWHGHLNLNSDRVRGSLASIYTPRGGDADGVVEVYQVHAQRTIDGPVVACGWDVIVDGTFVEHYATKTDAQRYAEQHLIRNAYNFEGTTSTPKADADADKRAFLDGYKHAYRGQLAHRQPDQDAEQYEAGYAHGAEVRARMTNPDFVLDVKGL